MLKNKSSILIILIVILALTKLYRIDGGFVPSEPDERTYAEVVKNLHFGLYPQYDGIALFNSPPLFHYIGYLFSLVIPGYYSPLRVVSVLASLSLALVLFKYLRTRYSETMAFLGVAVFSLLPITVYFSRLGLLEMLVTLFAFLFIVCFELAFQKQSYKWALVSGLSLGLGVLTKYSILPLILVPLFYLGYSLSKEALRVRNFSLLKSKKLRNHFLIVGFVFFVAGIITLPVLFLNYTFNPLEFKNQFKYVFSLRGRPVNLGLSGQYLLTLPTFLSWPGVLLLLLGIMDTFKKRSLAPAIGLSLLLLVYSIIRIGLYEPRYFVILVPFIAVFLTGGIDQLVTLSQKMLKIKPVFIGIILLAFLVPSSTKALLATQHTTIEEIGNFVKNQNQEERWVTTNYWPSAFTNEVGYKITWLTIDPGDAQSHSGLIGSTFYKIETDSLQTILKEGGWVILESLYSPKFSDGPRRVNGIDYIKSNYIPARVFEDKAPNWPNFTSEVNTYSVYKIEAK